MIKLNNISEQIFLPFKSLVIYRSAGRSIDYFVEAYDIDNNGSIQCGHPLSIDEGIALAKCLATTSDLNTSYLQCDTLIPDKLLYTNIGLDGFAVWYTPTQTVGLNFIQSLTIPNGKLAIPAMVWKADRSHLEVFAIKGTMKPKELTQLYHAPFFNIYREGKVCMGTVKIEMDGVSNLQFFMERWERYFFDSYFSHMMDGHNPVNGNLVQLWKGLAGQNIPFPESALKKTDKTLKNLLS